MAKERYVIVTTEHRGVFAGVLASYNKKTKTAKLTQGRMVVYWSAESKGVVGLAVTGPAKGSRVTPAVPAMELEKTTAVIDCTEDARKGFEAQPWA